ncbi:MAG: 3-oxoacyl-[acyl-carrier-protein] synthase II [Glaciecola sp.]|jgi:3-oxoacyl-[acyl-carrier-protein] synthase II
MSTNRVVVTGLGALSPIGNTISEFWKNLVNGKSGAAAITNFDSSKFKTKFACELKNFNSKDYIPRSEARRYDPFTQYALIASEEAITNAGLKFEELDTDLIGVIWGSGNGGMLTFQEQMKEYAAGDGTPRFNPFFIPKVIADIAAGVISMKHGLRGVNFATISACATSNTAIIEAFNYIKWGKANVIITGGSEAAITESGIGGFNAARALSQNNDNPTGASKPFDINRDGFVMGEGAGALVLENLDHALARGANIIAEVVGGGMAADAYHLTGTHPEGEGAFLGMRAALKEADISPDSIDYVNAHATSTPQGDISELTAIERTFGTRKTLNIGATKSMTGHLLGAAGAIEAIACIKAIETDIIPPTINTTDIEEQFKDKYDFCLGKAQYKTVNYAISNTFGFGGHIASAIFKKYTS